MVRSTNSGTGIRDDGEIHKLGDWNAGANVASLDILFHVTQVKKG